MSVGRKVLIVDDKTPLSEMLNEQLLLLDEFIPNVATCGEEALKKSKKHCFEVILLDVNLPDIDSRKVCRLLRSGKIQSPIIIMANVDTNVEAFLIKEVGATDYITKPFRLVDLLAKMRAHIYQHEHSDDLVFTIGPY